MTIETKYNIGDVVWTKRYCNFYKLKITQVVIKASLSFTYIEYMAVEEDDYIQLIFPEQDLFPTKEELLKSL